MLLCVPDGLPNRQRKLISMFSRQHFIQPQDNRAGFFRRQQPLSHGFDLRSGAWRSTPGVNERNGHFLRGNRKCSSER